MDGVLRVKICGLTRPEDARAAAAAGADFVGFVLAGGPRHVEPVRARSLGEEARRAAGAGAGPEPVAVLVDVSADEARAAATAAAAGIVQLHGEETPAVCADLRAAGLVVWKAVRPRSLEELREMVGRYEASVDALHLEGWSPRAAGGTGTGFPWRWIATLRAEGVLSEPGSSAAGEAAPPRPLLVLAGGLDPDNVGEALRRVRPDAVDVSSGVEVRPGIKDPDLVRAFVRRARGAVE